MASWEERLTRTSAETTDVKRVVVAVVVQMRVVVSGVGVLEGLLYAVGGHDGPLVRKSVEYYQPETSVWRQTADMHLCRRNAGTLFHFVIFFFTLFFSQDCFIPVIALSRVPLLINWALLKFARTLCVRDYCFCSN